MIRGLLTVLLMTCLVLVTAMAGQAPIISQAPPTYAPDLPIGATKYTAARWTQSIYVLNNGSFAGDRIDKEPITKLEAKWHVSGGMLGIKDFRSEKYRLLPSTPKTWVGNIEVSFQYEGRTYHQHNRGILRSYPDGTRFDDVLSYGGVVFEHRTREKVNGSWRSRVLYTDADARPPGYTGLKVSCSSCHDEAGTGKYGVGLVPGGDTVLSDELDWSIAKGY